MKPPANCSVKNTQMAPPVSMKTEQANRKAEESKQKAAQAVAKAVPSPTEKVTQAAKEAVAVAATQAQDTLAIGIIASQATTKGEELALPPSDEYQKLLPILGDVQTLLAGHRKAAPLPQRCSSAEENVAHFLEKANKNGPLGRAAEVDKLAAQVAKLRSSLASLQDDISLADTAASLRAKLHATESELEKKRKDAPTAASEHAAIVEARSAFETAVEERRGRAEKGKVKAEERVSARKELFRKLRCQLVAAELAAEKLEKDNSEEHNKRSQVLEKLDIDTRAAFGEKASCAADKKQQEETNKTLQQQTQGPQAQEPQATADPAAQACQRLEQAKAAFERQLQQLREEQQKQIAELQRQLASQQRLENENHRKAQEFRAMTLAFEATAQVTADELPTLTAPPTSQLQGHAQLYQLLTVWSTAGAATPFTFQDLIAHSMMGSDAPLFVRTALGTKWTQWFSADPGLAHIVPRQVAQLLLASLEKLRAQWQEDEARDNIAEQGRTSYAAMVGIAKKRRAELLDHEMVPAP